MAVFRKASAVGRVAARSQREAFTQPHLVLVEALTEMSRLLPRAAAGANLDQAEIFKTLPPLFVTYFKLILEKELQRPQMQRNEREARTLCEILDWAFNPPIRSAHRISVTVDAGPPNACLACPWRCLGMPLAMPRHALGMP